MSEQLPIIVPHAELDEDPSGRVGSEESAAFLAQLTLLEAEVFSCVSYDEALRLREIIGSQARQSDLLRGIQAATESRALGPAERKELSKLWHRCHRKLAKLEVELAPGLLASFIDESPNQQTSNQEETMTRMQLAAVTRGRVKRPLKLVAYGPEGVGKSTFASQAPDPVFLCAEDGTSQLDVARFPEPKTWAELAEAMTELKHGEHPFKTLVVDSLDWLQPMLVKHVCDTDKIKESAYHDFGRGEKFAVRHWKILQESFDELRATRGMHVICLAHCQARTFKNPEGEDFDRYQLALPPSAEALWKQWPDTLLFLSWEMLTQKLGERAKGVQGERMIYTERTAAWDAKNRYGLPPSLPFTQEAAWRAFADAVKATQVTQPTKPKDETQAA